MINKCIYVNPNLSKLDNFFFFSRSETASTLLLPYLLSHNLPREFLSLLVTTLPDKENLRKVSVSK